MSEQLPVVSEIDSELSPVLSTLLVPQRRARACPAGKGFSAAESLAAARESLPLSHWQWVSPCQLLGAGLFSIVLSLGFLASVSNMNQSLSQKASATVQVPKDKCS